MKRNDFSKQTDNMLNMIKMLHQYPDGDYNIADVGLTSEEKEQIIIAINTFNDVDPFGAVASVSDKLQAEVAVKLDVTIDSYLYGLIVLLTSSLIRRIKEDKKLVKEQHISKSALKKAEKKLMKYKPIK